MEVEKRDTGAIPEVNLQLSDFNENERIIIIKKDKDCVGLLNIPHMPTKAEGEKRISPDTITAT